MLPSFLCFLTFGLHVVLCLWVVAAVWGMAPARSARWRTWWNHSTVRVPLASHLHCIAKDHVSERNGTQTRLFGKKRTLSYLPSRCTWPMAVCHRKPLHATFQRACGWPRLYCPWWFPPPHSHLSSSTWPVKRHCKTVAERKIPWHHRVGLQSSWWWPVAVSRCCCCVTLSLAHMVAGLGDFNETQGCVMSSDMS